MKWSDLIVFYNLWFKPIKRSKSHQERLESFYKDQAEHYDSFRERFLHGRREMLQVASAHLNIKENIVWADLGGGTGENVLKMFEWIPKEMFAKIYVVDLCPSLCNQAIEKMKRLGLDDLVEVVCEDACKFAPPCNIDLITFSYSLSMIPPFHKVIDHAYKILDQDGIIAVVDFVVSSKYDQCYRQMSWARRMFWRSIFDIDGIDIGPERRAYLDNKFYPIYEQNNEGSIPYIPYLRPPYYVWIGNKTGKLKHVFADHKEAPIHFPPTFLYHQSWEDPDVDRPVLDIKPTDVCLTLTAGGCNTLHMLMDGAKEIYSVDVNPAQNALLELKQVAIQELTYEDVWQMFGKGKHPKFEYLYETKLSPFLSETARRFWNKRKDYFNEGLYTHGSMGKIHLILNKIFYWFGVKSDIDKIRHADTIEEQRNIWNNIWIVKTIFNNKILSKVLMNDIFAWFGGGVPYNQSKLIKNDGMTISDYLLNCIENVIDNSLISKENYFWYNILYGEYTTSNCPAYITKEGYNTLRDGRLSKLVISTNYFIDELKLRMYDKIDMMDHVDWLSSEQSQKLAETLWNQINDNGKVIFRSAGLIPPYVGQLMDVGFNVKCISNLYDEDYIDRVNMYASFWVAEKIVDKTNITNKPNEETQTSTDAKKTEIIKSHEIIDNELDTTHEIKEVGEIADYYINSIYANSNVYYEDTY